MQKNELWFVYKCYLQTMNLYIVYMVIMDKVFANSPGDLGSFPGRDIPKMVLDPSLLNTNHYKVKIKGKVEQSRKRIDRC